MNVVDLAFNDLLCPCDFLVKIAPVTGKTLRRAVDEKRIVFRRHRPPARFRDFAVPVFLVDVVRFVLIRFCVVAAVLVLRLARHPRDQNVFPVVSDFGQVLRCQGALRIKALTHSGDFSPYIAALLVVVAGATYFRPAFTDEQVRVSVTGKKS